MKRMLFLCFILGLGSAAFAQTRTVTNSELEKYREKRVRSEQELRENYKRLGFPSPEELARRREAQRASMEQLAGELREQQLQKQSDILAEANVLRSQIASIEAQINYLRSQIGNYSSDQGVILSFGLGTSFPSRGGYPYRGGRPSLRRSGVVLQTGAVGPNVQMTQDISRMYPNSQDIYNRSIGNYAFQNQRPFGRRFGRRGFRGGFAVPIVVGATTDYAPNYLEAQLIFLEQQRAGLLAQWRLLEDRARRAGVKID